MNKAFFIGTLLLYSINLISCNTFTWQNESMVSDYIAIQAGKAKLFFLLAESRNDPSNDPLVIWMNGGPGCSSLYGFFTENGPYNLYYDSTQSGSSAFTITSNPYSWNNKANVMFLEQPIGVGFSTAKFFQHRFGAWQVAYDFYDFLVAFLDKYPEYKGRALYLAGESYAGHYIPPMAHFLVDRNNQDINLQGLALGNAWVDAISQYPMYNKYAYENDLVSKGKYVALKVGYALCSMMLKIDILPLASGIFCDVLGAFINVGNYYDIRLSTDYPDDGLQEYVNSAAFYDLVSGTGTWVECDNPTYWFFLLDEYQDYGYLLTTVLEAGIPVLVFSGDKDYICNWRGGEAWTERLGWSGQREFNKQSYKQWFLDGGSYHGEYKAYGKLMFLRLYDAGHMVPFDQPSAAHYMINQLLDLGTIQ